jgi:hypothetical protein
MLLRDLRQSIEAGSATRPRDRLSSLRHWHWRLLNSWLIRAAAGHSIVLIRAHRRRLTTRVALQVDLLTRSRARAKVHLGRCCDAIAAVERTRFVRAWARDLEREGASRRPLDDAPAGHSGVWEPGHLDAAHGVGFHAASVIAAEAIRWSEPAAYVELPLAAGRYVIRLNWLFPPRVGGETRPRFYLDERPIPAENVSVRRDHVELRVHVPEASSPPRLGWVCPANRADGADRALGVPVVSLAWAREDARSSRVTALAATWGGC